VAVSGFELAVLGATNLYQMIQSRRCADNFT